MNRSDAKKLLDNIELVKAFANGQDIEFITNPTDTDWCIVRDPSFSYPKKHYRIKPRPFEGWVNVYSDGLMCKIHSTRKKADDAAGSKRIRCVFVREVEGK